MVDAVSSSLSGLNKATARLAKAGENIANANPSKEGAADKVRLDQEIVESKAAKVEYKANAKVLKAQLENEKQILDILV